jgi:uncharacterized protein YecE (DUF72 family)
VTRLPEGFTMTVKASRYLTHIKRLRDPEEPVARLMDRIAPLREGGRLGPVLLQLPPNFDAVPDLLARTMAEFPDDVQLAVEPRDPTWFTSDVEHRLRDRDAALVWADRDAAAVTPLWETASWRYLRLHHGRHDWGYDDRDLAPWVERMAGRPGFIYTNNDPGGAAIQDALRLRELLAAADSFTG